MREARRRVWVLTVPGAELLDVCGPWEVLGHTNDVLGHEAYALELLSPAGGAFRSRHGLMVGGARPLPARLQRPPELVIVAGGSPQAPPEAAEGQLSAWLRRHRERIPNLASICTGAFLLGEAGLLDGRRVTTHWRFLDLLRQRYPAASVVDEGIFVRDGSLWSSAGITAGIDLTLAIVERDHGRQVAMEVARKLVLFLRRSGNQAQFSTVLERQQKEPPQLRNVSAFVLEHLDEPLPVERLAKAVSMSPRSLTRWCRKELGEAPAELVRRLRVEEARRLLADTSMPLKDVSARTGIGDASTLWRVFTQRFGVTPAEYRARFAVA